MTTPTRSFEHLDRLTDGGGLFEHARGADPRPEHGYCVDDVARALVVTAREPSPTASLRRLRTQYLTFVLAAQDRDGRFRNRRRTDLVWTDLPSVDDCWGRALWGLGSVVRAASAPGTRVDAPHARSASAAFDRGAGHRSPQVRATAFAGLGAAEVLRVRPDHAGARSLLADAAERVDAGAEDPVLVRNGWVWPEPRLGYANAVVPEVLVAAGALLDRPHLLRRGVDLLEWLLAVQSRDHHLSVVPVGGLGPGEAGPGSDQRPLEVGSLADACATAFEVTGEARWATAVRRCVAWFAGDNDFRTPMLDITTGGGFDALTAAGRDDNQGAGATLSLLSTLQHGLRLGTDVVRLRPDDPVDLTAPTTAVRARA